MRNISVLLFTISLAAAAGAQPAAGDLVLVEGGPFRNTKSNYSGKIAPIANFYIGRHEVTQREWTALMGANPSKFQGDDLPVESVSWYDCIDYCNRRSAQEGLAPYYTIDRAHKDPNNRTAIDEIKWTVTINRGAKGYRLPTEAEWEYAAGGGRRSRSFTYSGGEEVAKVAWYWQNSGDKFLDGFWSWPLIESNHNRTKPVGGKEPNELGIFDMSGNVREWCWNWYGDQPSRGTEPDASSAETGRVWRGGGWMGGDFCCALTFRAHFEASGKGADQGFRVCRDP